MRFEDDDQRKFVSAVYRALLKREPDAGIEYHLQKLKSTEHLKRHDNVSNMLLEMQQSSEYTRRIFDTLSAGCRPAVSTYSHVISLGTSCYTAFLLKYAGLRHGAYPFDWVFSSQEMINHCLEDNFYEFLNPNNFCPVPLAERKHGENYNKTDNSFYMANY